jgi:hypothetical protein
VLSGGGENPPEPNYAGAIDLQRFHCGSPNRRQSYDQALIVAPTEMVAPGIFARIEEPNKLSTRRVERDCLSALVTVAAGAGKSQVLERACPASALGHDMIQAEGANGKLFLAATVFAGSVSALGGCAANGGTHPVLRHKPV